MAMLQLGGDPKSKKKKDVDACVDGDCGPKTRGKMSLSKFSPTKKRYSVGTYEVDPKPSGNLHMNMRDLGSNPGDTRMQKSDSKSAITPAQEQKGRFFNAGTRKEKKALKMQSRK